MAKKIDRKVAALAAAQGSGAVFDVLEEDAVTETVAANDVDTSAAALAAEQPTRISENKDKPSMNAHTTFAPTTEAATDAMRQMFDGKAMVERTQKLAQEAADLARGNLEAMAASAKIAAQNAGTLTQDVAAVGRKSFEGASEAMKGFAEAKTPAELLRLQGEFAKTYMETMISEGARMSEMFVKLTGEALEPVQTRIAATAAKVRGPVQ